MRFGLSTHLFHGQPLSEAHLTAVADHGFLDVELFATRTHFDYYDTAAVRDLRTWLSNTGQTLHSVHAPIVDGYRQNAWGKALSNALTDGAARLETIRETEVALRVAETIPFRFLVVHLGVPESLVSQRGDNNGDAARRSVEELHTLATKYRVQLALEVIPNSLSTVDALVQLIDDDLELPDVGLCLDYGHAFLMGDVSDAIQSASGHLVTTHIHDNDGRQDSHLVPFDGRIDWSTAAMTTQKVGYDGVWMMELTDTGDSRTVLQKGRDAARRLEALMMFQD